MLATAFGRDGDYALLVLRLFIGGVFIGHGALKLFGGLPGFELFLMQHGVPFARVMAPVVAGIEFLGGVAFILGLWTRLAALLLICVIIVAMVTVTLPQGFAGGYDLNLALLGGLIALFLAGPGKFAYGGDL